MRKTIAFILLILSAACKEAYDPPVVSANRSYLVVEGFINIGPDSTLFTLSRTYKIYDTLQTAPPELNAQVSVQGDDNSVYPLAEMGGGKYGAADLALDPARQYRVTIVTSDGRQYRSDLVPVKISPPIDSVSWVNTDNGLQIGISTHDPQNNSRYYHWSFSETWEFHTAYAQGLQYANRAVTTKFPVDNYYCWQTDSSTHIILGSSTQLSQDEIYEAPLTLEPPGSPKLGILYSILVKQTVLTPDAFAFWLNLKTNTEQIGSIFSPQPSAAKTNLHCITDSTEQVIGYVSAGRFVQQRFFIDPTKIPGWYLNDYRGNCMLMKTANTPDSLYFFFSLGGYLPIDYFDPTETHVVYSDNACVDCRLQGTNVKPSFWP